MKRHWRQPSVRGSVRGGVSGGVSGSVRGQWRRWTGFTALARLRRMLGLYAFFYGTLHFLCYAWLDMGLYVDDIVRDIGKRPFILVGAGTLLLMLPLAATSFNRAIRALGAARWQALHRLVYAIASRCCTSTGCVQARTTSPSGRCMRC